MMGKAKNGGRKRRDECCLATKFSGLGGCILS
jgi:hypothetical protein